MFKITAPVLGVGRFAIEGTTMTSKTLGISMAFASLLAIAAASDVRAQVYGDADGSASASDPAQSAIVSIVRAHMLAYKRGDTRAMLAVWEADGYWQTTNNGCCSSTTLRTSIADAARGLQARPRTLTFEIENPAVHGDDADVRVVLYDNGRRMSYFQISLHRNAQNHWRIRMMHY